MAWKNHQMGHLKSLKKNVFKVMNVGTKLAVLGYFFFQSFFYYKFYYKSEKND